MDDTEAFYDFGVSYNKDVEVLREMCQQLIDMGYKTIAIEQQCEIFKTNNGKCTDVIPPPCNLEGLLNEFKNKLKILQRITIIYDDCNITNIIMKKSSNLKKYHIVAGQPKTETTFTNACSTFAGDIITLHPQDGSKYVINRKAYQIAIKRNIFFEIKYAWCMKNSVYRKDVIKLAHNYFTSGKSKNIVLSSGATNAFELRSPFDVANMSFIFNLSEDQGKCAINRFSRRLFLRAESRRLGKTIMFIKASGPVVFSDSSETSSNDSSANEENTKQSSASKQDDYEIPNKKQKTC